MYDSLSYSTSDNPPDCGWGVMGIVGGESRHYSGPNLSAPVMPWKCPRCGAEQVSDPTLGCAHCTAGTAKAYKAQPAEPPPENDLRVLARPATLDEIAAVWAARNPAASLREAFLAGYEFAARTATKPAAEAFPAAHKRTRTIVAALRLFRDQVLREADEEVESGEWASAAEVTTWIAELEEETR